MQKNHSFHESLATFFATKVQALGQDVSTSSNELEAMLTEVERYSQNAFQNKDAFFRLIDLLGKKDLEETPNVEKILLDEMPKEDFERLQIPSYAYPKMVRGLPRYYQKQFPSRSIIKPQFRHLPSLRKQMIDKANLSLFEELDFPPSSVVLFTFVMPGGLGDFAAQMTMANLLAEKFPSLSLEMITLVDEESAFFSSSSKIPCFKLFFPSNLEQYPKVEDFPVFLLEKMRNAALIIQLPTYYPLTERLLQKITTIESQKPFPQYELIGEYGFGESRYFHPQTGARSMGLHFLEKGILIHKREILPFTAIRNIEDKSLLESLFGSEKPTQRSLSLYLQKRHLYFAYLVTDEGHYLYLHALLKYLHKDPKDLDLVVTDLRRFIHNFSTRLKVQETYPLLIQYGVKKVVMHFRKESFDLHISEKGKEIHFHCMENLSRNDFSLLCQISEEFVGCRGDGSFSEVVSANKVYFYDGLDHAKNFLKDLVSIAQSTIPHFHSTISYLKTFLERIRLDVQNEDDWVDELFFQKDENLSLYDRGEKLGNLLLSSSLQAGIKRLNQILQKEYSFNRTFFQLVTRKLIHYHKPDFAKKEERLLHSFEQKEISFVECIEALKKEISVLPKRKKIK